MDAMKAALEAAKANLGTVIDGLTNVTSHTETAKAAYEAAKANLGPAIHSFNNITWDMDTAKAAFEAAKAEFEPAIEGLNNVDWEQLPHFLKAFIIANPWLSATQLVFLIVWAFPGIATSPALVVLGFSGRLHAGGWAAAFQSVFGVNPVFSALQSAGAMGATGTAAVNGAMANAAAIGSSAMWAFAKAFGGENNGTATGT